MTGPRRLLAAGAIILAAVALVQARAPQTQTTPVPAQAQPLTFKSGVDVVAVDVQVVDRDGKPIPGLGPDDFDVTIDNKKRAISTVDLVEYKPGLATHTPVAMSALPAPGDPVDPAHAAPLARGPNDRVYVLAVDEASFAPGPAQVAMRDARHFLDSLQPTDLVALYSYPYGKPRLDLQHDHAKIAAQLSNVIGRAEPPMGEFHLTDSEIVDITGNDGIAISQVATRICPGAADITCLERIRNEARVDAAYLAGQAEESLSGLRQLLNALPEFEGRKTVVVVSGGLVVSDRVSGQPDVSGLVTKIGEEASAANANLYLLHLDSHFASAFSAANPSEIVRFTDGVGTTGAVPVTRIENLMRDEGPGRQGLEMLAGKTNGVLLHVEGTSPAFAFDRVLRETSAYYLLGVQPADVDRTGKLHVIHVKVKAKGAIVRSRTEVFIPKHDGSGH